MLKPWKAFLTRHVRPYVIFADLPDGGQRQQKYSTLTSLARELKLRGDYSMMPEEQMIRMIFELEADAKTVAECVLAGTSAREPGYAGQWCFSYDAAVHDKVRAQLPTPPKRGAPGLAKRPRRPGSRLANDGA